MKRKIHILISSFLLAIIVFASVPKVYIHNLLGHNHSQPHHSIGLVFSENNETQDCNFEKFDTTIYFTLHHFYSNFSIQQVYQSINFHVIQSIFFERQLNSNLLRGPPIA